MNDTESIVGAAALARMAFSGEDLLPLAEAMMHRIERDPKDAAALMDLSTIFHLLFKPGVALSFQSRALAITPHYHLPAPAGNARIRMLAIMTAGDLMANTPIDFLLANSRISLDMLYVAVDLPFPKPVPEHDIVFVAVADSDENAAVLEMLQEHLESWSRPVLNMPARIGRTTREGTFEALRTIPEIEIPPQSRVGRVQLEAMAAGASHLGELIPDAGGSVVVRPVDSHAGRGLEKMDTDSGSYACIRDYLSSHPDDCFYLSSFVDYRSQDGLYRKYRVVLIDGKPYASHMAISSDWMVHYLNAGMLESAEKRREEEEFMVTFDAEFAVRHQEALRKLNSVFDLDYLVVDCAESRDNRLLVFEVDSSAVVHAMDPVEIFPYKHQQMGKVFAAFQRMVAERCGECVEPV
ncbi:MAG TPA: RimK family alpha-L-glutamate ligase [Spirochaetia bacterium]|nr:RimK family alpha-L-glutamate ligase [Spirochaetia bacterium]